MHLDRKDTSLHATQVDAWANKTINGQAADVQLQIASDLIRALKKRTLMTLSLVTWNAILDRALHESQQKFASLFKLKIEDGEIILDVHSNGKNAADISNALRFLLIELLTIVENLTAGILTQPLYRELEDHTILTRTKSASERGNA